MRHQITSWTRKIPRPESENSRRYSPPKTDNADVSLTRPEMHTHLSLSHTGSGQGQDHQSTHCVESVHGCAGKNCGSWEGKFLLETVGWRALIKLYV